MKKENDKNEESWKEIIIEWGGSVLVIIILTIVFTNNEILKFIFLPFSILSYLFGIGLAVAILIIAAHYLKIIK